ncbi:mediator of RNA polymerase II transcription subunit 1-like [Physella acuta]|uniref:mediator of RNA polymerase II transcription subunit 1-like n=1 Tax=Physella acuta TaxID=109671 RepID=UPI0027DBF677|nr:mediator of RNA polymerase II transcription subunit 1-like [Physella acuta]
MAAETGIPSVYLEHQLSHGRATKRQQGSIIEKLRHRSAQNRSWTDSIKTVRNAVAERRMQADNMENSCVKKCLDTIQKAMKVISPQTLKERLDLIGRQLGLTTNIQEQKVSIGTDAFQVDVILDGGTISNVKLANQGDIIDCPDLRDILKKGDFTEFIEHLQGLQSIYQVTNDEKLKSKAFLVLQALEKDLNQLAQFQSSINGVANYIHKCPLGIMLPRLAGKPMKLIYFVSPYDLLDKKSLKAHPLTVEAVTENFLGQSVTVCIEPVQESAGPNKLQTMPLMNVSKTPDGKSLPTFSAVTKINSMMLPASFVLILPQSIPISIQLLQKINTLTTLEIHKDTEIKSLRSLILESFSGGKIKDNKKLYVSLPDQQHIYILDGLNGGLTDQQGVMVSRIPFTHPTHVPQILNSLRQQLLFNIVIGSCIRPGANKDLTNTIVFEITAVSLQQLTIVFEHPAYDSLITVDIDLSDITNVKCRVACSNPDQILCSDELASRIFQRCMSIPILLRWLISKGRGQLDKLKEAALAAEKERKEKALFLKEMQRQAKLQATTLPTKGRPPPQPPHPPPLPPPPSYPLHHYSPMHVSHGHISSNGQTPLMPMILSDPRNVIDEFRNMTETNSQRADALLMSPELEKGHNPLLSTLLDADKMTGGVQTEVHDSPMLSRLLDDNTSVATTVIPMNCKPTPNLTGKRPRKRRSQSEISGPSPKHRFSEVDSSDRLSSMELDMGTPIMGSSSHHHHHHHQMLNHAANVSRTQGNVIDLTEDNLVVESSTLKKLAESVDKHFIHKDVKSEQDLSMLLSETEAASRIPNILQNSPSGSKNENASTSLEVILKGSGEVGRAKDFDPSDVTSVHNSTNLSKLSSLLLASSDSPTMILSAPPHKANSHFFSDGQLGSDKTFGAVMGRTVAINSLLQDVKPTPTSLRKGLLQQSSSVDHPNDIGIFEKFDITRQQQNVAMDISNNELKSQTIEGKVSLKLRVGPLKQQNAVKPLKSAHSVDESDLVYSKSNNIGTFDFKSDEDEDDPIRFSDRFVYSSSPPRVHISSNKQKRGSDSSISQKSEKTKKKERSSGNTTKRKRDKDESKREKKRKKAEHVIQESVYRTVENDSKTDIKLKIRVAKKPLNDKSDISSDGKIQQSYEISKKSLPSPNEKYNSNKDSKESIAVKDTTSISISSEVPKEKDLNATNSHKSISSTSSTKPSAAHKPSPKTVSSKLNQVVSISSKPDPKLVTKATIRLKPLTMLNSTVNISQSKTSTTCTNTSKTDRRSSTTGTPPVAEKRSTALNTSWERKSSSVDRRNSIQSSVSTPLSSSSTSTTNTASTTSVTPTTSANLSLSSILPNAPTVSKIASLPRIPKLSSSSSTTSINRTSSLDPASGASPAPSGTKDNNSYNVGPAGRPNSSSAAGSGRASASSGASFNYGTNRLNLHTNRLPGPTHRQTSPNITSGQSGQQRSGGVRSHHTSSGGSTPTGQKQVVNSHKTSSSSTGNATSKGSSGKSFGPVKIGLNNSNKLTHTNLNMAQKASAGINNSGLRQAGHTAHNRSSSAPGNVSRSPNTSGLTKSPSSGKSPNISNSSKSPNISSAGRSPSLTSSNKSPNITNVSRSPNMSSGKSPNINPNRSPSRPSPGGKSHKHSSASSKPAVSKSQATDAGANFNPGGTTKVSHNKNVMKTTPSPAAQPNKNVSLSSSSSKSVSLSGIEPVEPAHQPPSTLQQKPLPDESEHNFINKGSSDLPSCAMARSTSSTPTTPMSADNCKTKFSFPSASRGRKNSLSAIVDKLKHNAVGSGIDLVGVLHTPTESHSAVNSMSLLDTESQKQSNRDSKNGIQCVEVQKQDENKPEGNMNCVSVNSPFNHSSSPGSNKAHELCDSSTKTYSLENEKSTKTKAAKTLEDRSINICKSSELNHGLDLTVPKEKGHVHKIEMPSKALSLDNKHSSKKDKPSPLKLPSPIQSPSASPFHPQSSPNSSPLNTCTVGSAKQQKDSDDKIFKIPSVKQDELSETGKVDLLEKCNATKNKDSKVKNSASSLSSPLSDISSPENGLVIDDEESTTCNNILPKVVSSGDKALMKAHLPKEDSSIQLTGETSPLNNVDVPVSPKGGTVSATRSPALAKTPKCSDSPCEIDDDLMDVALGFGSC